MAVDFRIEDEVMMISVAMASYNGEKYIWEQLETIYNQTRKVDEIVIVDDCSTDGTSATIKRFMETYPDSKICFYENEINLGYKKNFHKAISLCKGDVIFLCDQDDAWLEHKVEVLQKVFEDNEDISLVSSSFMSMDGQGQKDEVNRSVYQKKMCCNQLIQVPLDDLLYHNISQGCSMAVRREIVDLYLKNFSDELPHDWMLNVIAAMKKKCYYLNKALFYYRIHDNNTIGLNDGLTLKEKNTFKVRKHDAWKTFLVTEYIKTVDEDYHNGNEAVLKASIFAIRHVKYLRNKKWFQLILQNFNPCYWKLKTMRGRLLDIVFCFSNTNPYEEEEE